MIRNPHDEFRGVEPLRPCPVGGEPRPVAKRSNRNVLLTGSEATRLGAEHHQPRRFRVQRGVVEPSRTSHGTGDAIARGNLPSVRPRAGFPEGRRYRIFPSLHPVWHPRPYPRRAYGCHGGAHRPVERDAGRPACQRHGTLQDVPLDLRRGLLGVSQVYEVIASRQLNLLDNLPGYLTNLEGRGIVSPARKPLWPDTESLQWHHENVLRT